MEHILAELLLEQQNLAADRRLRDAELLARRGEGAGIRNRADDLQLPQIHARQDTCAARMGATRSMCVLGLSLGEGSPGSRDRFFQIPGVELDLHEAHSE